MHAAIFGLGPMEFVIVLVVIVVLFLPAFLPKILKRLGDTFGALRDMTDNIKEDDDTGDNGDNGA